jgi:hypothetical protein
LYLSNRSLPCCSMRYVVSDGAILLIVIIISQKLAKCCWNNCQLFLLIQEMVSLTQLVRSLLKNFWKLVGYQPNDVLPLSIFWSIFGPTESEQFRLHIAVCSLLTSCIFLMLTDDVFWTSDDQALTISGSCIFLSRLVCPWFNSHGKEDNGMDCSFSPLDVTWLCYARSAIMYACPLPSLVDVFHCVDKLQNHDLVKYNNHIDVLSFFWLGSTYW